jgi:hypothetical protein
MKPNEIHARGLLWGKLLAALARAKRETEEACIQAHGLVPESFSAEVES